MILYKNVDICDLESICKNGILSMYECGNNNWNDGKRSDNSTSVVYLFSPIKTQNSFPNYGVALLEIDCLEATEHEMSDMDIHKYDYTEYITNKVHPSQIKRILIPEIFKPYINIPESITVCWCGIEADCWTESGHNKASNEILEKFARTAKLMTSDSFNFFRGTNDDNTMIDLDNIRYIFD